MICLRTDFLGILSSIVDSTKYISHIYVLDYLVQDVQDIDMGVFCEEPFAIRYIMCRSFYGVPGMYVVLLADC